MMSLAVLKQWFTLWSTATDVVQEKPLLKFNKMKLCKNNCIFNGLLDLQAPKLRIFVTEVL